MATYLSYDIAVRSTSSVPDDKVKTKSWAMQPPKEMIFSSCNRFSSIFSRTEEVHKMSTRAKLVMKKYMGVWRGGWRTIATIINELPMMAVI